jgi:hypothetical protein
MSPDVGEEDFGGFYQNTTTDGEPKRTEAYYGNVADEQPQYMNMSLAFDVDA